MVQRLHRSHEKAFTRLDLVVVLAIVCVLIVVAFPLLGRSHAAGSEAVCMNNLRNLGRALLIYSDQNNGYVPEEGVANFSIFHSVNTDAWYNLAVQPEYPGMKSLYLAGQFPLPGGNSIHACPAAASPPSGQPSISWAFFMYGENNWLCVNKSTRASLGQAVQTRIATIPHPSVTILMGEVNDDYSQNSGVPALSGVTGPYAAARHNGVGLFTMCDGSVRAFATNDFNHPESSGSQEYFYNGSATSWPCYWWPSPTTPN